jgi:hypothetical protein
MMMVVRTYGEAQSFEELPGFWGPVVEQGGSLYLTYAIGSGSIVEGDVPKPILEAVLGDQIIILEWLHVGGGITDQGFVGYGVWKAVEGHILHFRMRIQF